MQQHTTTTIDVHHGGCPSRRIEVELPLATVEDPGNLAETGHITRQTVLTQITGAALISDTPQLPAGEDPVDRLAEHAHLTRRRSLELAAGSVKR